jgi:hypothetical protein
LEGGQSSNDFLDDFPSVTREAAIHALEHAKALVVSELEMKLLLDESIARKLTNSFLGHECSTMSEEGLGREEERGTSGTRGRIRLSAFLTLDRGIEYQQNLKPRNIAVILIRTKSNRLADLLVHVPEILRVLESVQPGQLAKVGQ